MSGIEGAEREDYDECQAGVAVVKQCPMQSWRQGALSGDVRQLVSVANGIQLGLVGKLPRFMIGNICDFAGWRSSVPAPS